MSCYCQRAARYLRLMPVYAAVTALDRERGGARAGCHGGEWRALPLRATVSALMLLKSD